MYLPYQRGATLPCECVPEQQLIPGSGQPEGSACLQQHARLLLALLAAAWRAEHGPDCVVEDSLLFRHRQRNNHSATWNQTARRNVAPATDTKTHGNRSGSWRTRTAARASTQRWQHAHAPLTAAFRVCDSRPACPGGSHGRPRSPSHRPLPRPAPDPCTPRQYGRIKCSFLGGTMDKVDEMTFIRIISRISDGR